MNSHNHDAFHHRSNRNAVEATTQPEHTLLSLRTVSSAALFGSEHEIGIDHRGSLYRLKITRQGKLILNK